MNHRHTIMSHFAAVAAIGLLASACAVTPQQQPATADLPPAGADGEYTVEFPGPSRGEARYIKMTVSEDVTVICHLEPHFGFDEDEPLPQDQAKVVALAACLNDARVSEYDVAVIGRTDARGSDAYNMGLAQERAESVKRLLAKHGVEASRLHVDVRGEQGAKQGDGLHSHGFDRRVDIELLGVVHAPEESDVSPTMQP